MITYALLFVASYLNIYLFLPVLRGSIYEDEYINIIIRHLMILYLSHQLSVCLWRQKFIPKIRIKPGNHAVLITGCDSGFGNMLARKLDKAGFKVFAACLLPQDQGAKQLEKDCSSKLRIVKMDVTSDSDVDAAYEKVASELKESNHQLLALINNAGILSVGEVEFGRSLRSFERQIEVNCLGMIRVTKAFTALLRRCETSPRLVNVTSLAGRISLPGMVGYCVSKSGALSFTKGIRVELQKWNIQVISVEPHLFRTNLVAMEAQHKGLRQTWDDSRPITRQDYGESFFEGAKRLLDYGIGRARTNVEDVVDAMYDSVTIMWPELHKPVFSSELEHLRCWFLINILPLRIQDFLLNSGVAYLTGKPAMLLQDRKTINKVR